VSRADATAGPDEPAYAALPRLDGVDVPHAWEVWGRGDQLGSLRRLTAERTIAALQEVRMGLRIGLDLRSDAIDPPLFGRRPLERHVRESGPTVDERLDSFYPQAASQWDGFGHYRVRGHGAFGADHEEPGIHHWAAEGIVARGVLLDVAGHRDRPGEGLAEGGITADELAEVAHAQGVELQAGDVLCVRTGWLRDYRALDQTGRAEYAAAGSLIPSLGLVADECTAAFLWDHRVAALVADNPAVEQTPGSREVGSLHRRVLAALGMPLGELLDLDRLATACRTHDRWTFAFVSMPLAVVGGVGSTANAMGIL
jgi:hypothetical protein